MRTVWVSFDTIGRDCLEAAADVGAEIVGVVTLPGPIDPNRSGQCSFDDVAERLGAVLHETRDVNSDETLAAVATLEPELIFVVGWSQLVRDPFIELARDGVFGMHPTLLPRHRGRAPIPWAILTGLARTGVTLFEIVDATADSGSIVGQVTLDIAPDETATTLFARIADAHVELTRELRPAASRAHRASHPARSEPCELVAEAHSRGRDHRLGDEGAVPLRLGARADAPVPRRVHVPRGREGDRLERASRRARRAAPAGTIVELRADGPVVACGEGGLVLEEIQTTARRARGRSEARMTPRPRPRGAPGRRGARDGRDDRRARRRGDEVRIVVVTDGSSTQYPGDAEIRARKEDEALRAAAELGVTDYVHLDLPDMRLDTLPHVEVNRVVEEHVGDFAPQRVYTPHPDVNRDHRVLFDSVAVATRPTPGQHVRRRPAPMRRRRARSGRRRRSTGSCRTGSSTSPATIERKVAAFAHYETERRDYPHPRSERAIRAAAEFYGSSCGCEHAEPFVLVRGLEPV